MAPIRHNDISDRKEVKDNENLTPKEYFNRAAGSKNDLFQKKDLPQLEAPNPFLTLLSGCFTLALVIIVIGLIVYIISKF